MPRSTLLTTQVLTPLWFIFAGRRWTVLAQSGLFLVSFGAGIAAESEYFSLGHLSLSLCYAVPLQAFARAWQYQFSPKSQQGKRTWD